MTTLTQFYAQYLPQLKGIDHIPEPKRLIRQLAAHRLKLRETQLLLDPNRHLDDIAPQLHQDLDQIVKGRPIAHVFGTQPFLDWDFVCDSRALIPRPETEALCFDVIEACKQMPPATILDLCTGSGILGIALALSFPEARVDLSDISPEALALTTENVRRHQLQDRLTIYESDLFKDIPEGTYDLIICNPPYVAADDPIGQAVLDHEPHLALFSDDDGQAHVKAILTDLPQRLAPNGLAVFELGHRHQQTLKPWLCQNLAEFQTDFRKDPFGVARNLWVRARMNPGSESQS